MLLLAASGIKVSFTSPLFAVEHDNVVLILLITAVLTLLMPALSYTKVSFTSLPLR